MTPRIEYGAELVSRARNVWIKDFNLTVITDWIGSEYCVGPVRLVMRVWDGETCGGWMPVVPTTTRPIPLPTEGAA